ncbi:hypothetical protein E3O45_14655 [Cryobacterium sp. TMS1-20-1]|uniref:hypothetical protein n=1 Tax=Cryobacterium sp. TMS1-20-1 TaxID=1259223 RepID=UPI00106DB1FC|nr:hypothetical protein [Cryobacterium sp. TMS1-20-1]TFC71323.1 hypothetical protein E3O45_14655 [Cryobacterium sp. TMS1-20-1]
MSAVIVERCFYKSWFQDPSIQAWPEILKNSGPSHANGYLLKLLDKRSEGAHSLAVDTRRECPASLEVIDFSVLVGVVPLQGNALTSFPRAIGAQRFVRHF